MTKSKKHGIGLSKQPLVIDPTGHTQSTVTVFVDDVLASGAVRDAQVDSHSHKWIQSRFAGAETLTDSHGTAVATAIRATAFCLRRKGSGGHYDGDDDLIVTVTYDDTTSGDTETDECTFTDVEYQDSVALKTKSKNDPPI